MHLGSLAYLGDSKGAMDLPVSARAAHTCVSWQHLPCRPGLPAALHCTSNKHDASCLARQGVNVCVNNETLVPPCIAALQIKTPFLKTLRGYLGAQAWRTLETLLQVGLSCALRCSVRWRLLGTGRQGATALDNHC